VLRVTAGGECRRARQQSASIRATRITAPSASVMDSRVHSFFGSTLAATSFWQVVLADFAV
jgi:hypothetical protein